MQRLGEVGGKTLASPHLLAWQGFAERSTVQLSKTLLYDARSMTGQCSHREAAEVAHMHVALCWTCICCSQHFHAKCSGIADHKALLFCVCKCMPAVVSSCSGCRAGCRAGIRKHTVACWVQFATEWMPPEFSEAAILAYSSKSAPNNGPKQGELCRALCMGSFSHAAVSGTQRAFKKFDC